MGCHFLLQVLKEGTVYFFFFFTNIQFSYCCCCSFAVTSDSFVTPWTEAGQDPLSMGFSRQEYWSGLPFSPPGDVPDPGIKPASLAIAGRSFTTESHGKFLLTVTINSRINPKVLMRQLCPSITDWDFGFSLIIYNFPILLFTNCFLSSHLNLITGHCPTIK